MDKGFTKTPKRATKYLTTLVTTLIILAIGFTGGTFYQKSHTPAANTISSSTAPATKSSTTSQSGSTKRARTISGTVTAITASKITVSGSKTGTKSILAITSTSVVTNNGRPASVSDIKVTNLVTVQIDTKTSPTGERVASQIALSR